ncbi:MAG: hypothetical protein IT310_05960 [Anaerolineales bacterium]|nr:hypothetical protein [Anaerolineales bacterium]
MTKMPIALKRIPLLAFLLCLTPLLIGIGVAIAEQKRAVQLETEGVIATATIKAIWAEKGGWRKRERYYLQYEFETLQTDGTRTTINHTEEVSRPHYWALQDSKSVEIRYLLSDPILIRSERYSINVVALILLILSIAGMLFLPGWASMLVFLFQFIGRERWYSKYILLVFLVTYIGLLIDTLSESTLHEHRLVVFMGLLMPVGVAILLAIGDIFRIPWLSDFSPRE